MAEKTAKKGILSRLFGKGKSGCCDFDIEEVPEEEIQSGSDERTDSLDSDTNQESADMRDDD